LVKIYLGLGVSAYAVPQIGYFYIPTAPTVKWEKGVRMKEKVRKNEGLYGWGNRKRGMKGGRERRSLGIALIA